MCASNFLAPFVETGRALCDGDDCHGVMNLITRRITETLGLKGCLVRMKSADGARLELVASSGLSEEFLFRSPDGDCTGMCFEVPGSAICIGDVHQGADIVCQNDMILEGIRAATLIPIDTCQESVAVVALFSAEPREFTKEEMAFASALAAQGVLCFVNKRRLEEGIDRERRYLQSFQEISAVINSSLTTTKVLELVVTKVTEILEAKGCVVRLLDQKTNSFYLAKAYGLSKTFLDKGPVDALRSMPENLSGKVVVIDDVFTDPRLQYPAETAEEGVRKLLAIPLMVRNKVIGVLRVFTGERPAFTKREINFATAIAHQCALAIENARMYQRMRYEYEQLLVEFDYDGSSH